MTELRSLAPNQQNKFPLCLAPMVGLSHVILRHVLSEYTPDKAELFLSPTEMLNSWKIPHEKLGYTAETLTFKGENFLVPQILGNEEQPIQQSIQKLKNNWFGEHNALRGIDINMGCPVQKALKHNYGVALMGDVDYAARVVDYAARASDLPVSVKLRAVGSQSSLEELIRFVDKLKNAGAAWITLHPRTAEQKRRGTADWDQVTELKKVLSVPLIGNGDIQTADDVFQRLDETRCDAVMAGRALAARPWMMWQVGESLGYDAPVKFQGRHAPRSEDEEGAEYGRMLLRFIELSDYYFCQNLGLKPDYALRKIQFFVRTTHVWLEFGHALTSVVNKSKTIPELIKNVEIFFLSSQAMKPRTELRQ